jgi:uncharacterized cupin superfamily protein
MSALPSLPAQSHCPDRALSNEEPGISLVQLAPDEHLGLEPGADRFVCVLDGVVYVAFEEDDAILLPGDQIVVRDGESHRAWNGGDEVARVVVGERTA